MSNSLHQLGQDADKLAHEHIIDPAMDLIHEAKTAVQHGTERTRKALTKEASRTQGIVGRLCHQAARLITANPLTAVSLALLAGAAMAPAARLTRV